MQADETMTKQESEEMIKQLEKVFDIVRLLDEETLYGGSGIESEGGEVCQCYSFWGRNEVCENCISLKVMQDKVQRTKLELLGQDFYQVISKYVKIDGKPYAMEMISRLDREVLVDDDGKNQLLSEISGYNDKLYRDALTGVYNRRYFEEKIKTTRFSAGVAMIDLDDFKIYNDTYGHEAGDMVLCGSRVSARCRPSRRYLRRQSPYRYKFWQDACRGQADRKSTRLNSSHSQQSRMPSSA